MYRKIFLLLIFLFPCVVQAEDTGLLWLVNKDYPICEDFKPPNIVNYRGINLRSEARDAFTEMISAMEKEKIYGLKLQSAYRTYAYQRSIYEQKRSEPASVQPPGASEHQLGLALDVSINGSLSQSFAETKAGKWLEENCHKFGFIIRYPQSKTDTTKIIYEPWHLRYVGHPHAQIMYENSLVLEEYHLFLKNIDMYIVWENDGYYLVSHSNFPQGETFSATSYGENASFIVTVKKAFKFT